MVELNLSPEMLAVYRATAERRREEGWAAEQARRERAWELALVAANLLKQRFHASRVVAFGSLVGEGIFTPWSDVDIAAWGISPRDTFRAIGAIMDLSNDPAINLVDVNTCSPSLLVAIERDGVDL